MTLVDKLLGSDVPYLEYAIPFFFLMIGVELVIAWLTRKELYRFNDSIADLSCGIIDTILRIFLETVLFSGYLYLFHNWRLLEIDSWGPAGKWTAAIALLFAQDLCFYWFHRIAHEYASPWATHVVHHSSEEYNLTVALRQSALERCFAWVFYLPLAIIGFPPAWFAAIAAINLLYQFWVHTETIGKLGPLEWVMNTPSHHRVHHARNPKYLDKNYAGMFIIWDRLFGTFQVEDEQPVYGLTRPLDSWNPIWANLHVWVDLYRQARQAPYWTDKLKIWFMPLGWTPRGVEPYPRAKEITRATLKKYNRRAPWGLSLYVLFQFVVALVVSLVVIHYAQQKHSQLILAAPAIFVLWSLMNLGAIFERQSWLLPSEMARLVVAPMAVCASARGSNWFATFAAITLAWATVSAIWLLRERHALLTASGGARTQPVVEPQFSVERAGVLSNS